MGLIILFGYAKEVLVFLVNPLVAHTARVSFLVPRRNDFENWIIAVRESPRCFHSRRSVSHVAIPFWVAITPKNHHFLFVTSPNNCVHFTASFDFTVVVHVLPVSIGVVVVMPITFQPFHQNQAFKPEYKTEDDVKGQKGGGDY